MMKNMTVVGLTGPTGSGKGVVGDVFKAHGFGIVYTDQLSREVTKPGSETLRALAEAFSDRILRPDGTLDRKVLAGLAFADPEQNKKLTDITHPPILALCREQLREFAEQGKPAAAVDAPLLFESGFDRECDITVAVLAPAQARLERIIRRDGLTREQAERRMAAQPDDGYYRTRADYCLESGEEMEDLIALARDLAALFTGPADKNNETDGK